MIAMYPTVNNGRQLSIGKSICMLQKFLDKTIKFVIKPKENKYNYLQSKVTINIAYYFFT